MLGFSKAFFIERRKLRAFGKGDLSEKSSKRKLETGYPLYSPQRNYQSFCYC